MKQNVLVLGSGGREHALVWKIAQSDLVAEVYCAPGNCGTGRGAVNVPIDPLNFSGIERFVKENNVSLTVVGPEAPLVSGIVDYFHMTGLVNKGHLVVGPSKQAALLEGSKSAAKEVMDKAGVPTAPYAVATDREQALGFCRLSLGGYGSVVIKADGLAAGKGVFVCDSLDSVVEALDSPVISGSFSKKNGCVVVENCLHGPEFSYIAICGGEYGAGFVPMASARDHKRLLDGDKGPNTGGMGAFSPTAVLSRGSELQVREKVVVPVMEYMKGVGAPFSGFLYVGGMLTDDGPKVLEFNVRMGDPETQPILARMKSDIVPYLLASAEGTIGNMPQMEFYDKAACCVVMASGGYPGDYDKGHVISGLDVASSLDDVIVFHAGTAEKDGRVVSAGGRVLGVTALGETLDAAQKRAYRACAMIHWKGSFYRRDIGLCETEDNDC